MRAARISGLFCDKGASAKSDFGLKTNLAVTLIEFCQSIFDEHDIGRGLGSGRSHDLFLFKFS